MHRSCAYVAVALSLAFAAPSGPVTAQPVYRCVDAAGTRFQDRACDAGAEGERLELVAAQVTTAPPPAVRELVERYEARRVPVVRGRGAPAAKSRAQRPAYRCTEDSGRVAWLNRPCPAPRARKGARAPGMRQELVTQREACEGRHASLDPYERDKRGPPTCR
ncbi:MAG TPA: DUF4124 domain-containing protein [Candidatus Saccharimonadia bacterium]|nr:DUF4124 domain-containing protein [Candidatus Saccharimonadia bacterium]